MADRKALVTIILKSASDAARTLLETMMTMTEWKDDFVEGFVNEGIRKGILEGIEQGMEQGRQQGMEQGRQQGMEHGIAKARAEDVLKILDARHIELTRQQREEVSACTDLAMLGLWFDRALTATVTAEIFSD